MLLIILRMESQIIFSTYWTVFVSTKPLINACKMKIMTASKRAKFIFIVVIFEAYSAYIVFFFCSWRPICFLQICDDKINVKFCGRILVVVLDGKSKLEIINYSIVAVWQFIHHVLSLDRSYVFVYYLSHLFYFSTLYILLYFYIFE